MQRSKTIISLITSFQSDMESSEGEEMLVNRVTSYKFRAPGSQFDSLCEHTYNAYINEIKKVLVSNKTSGFKIRYIVHPSPDFSGVTPNYSASLVKDFYVNKLFNTNSGQPRVTEVVIHFDKSLRRSGTASAVEIKCDIDFFPEARINGKRIPLIDGLFYQWNSGIGKELEYCSVEVSSAHIITDDVIKEWSS